jgi:hypothetical protein
MNATRATQKKFVSVCSICGCPLEREQIYASMCGNLWWAAIDKNARHEASLHFCNECFTKVAQFANESVETAVARVKKLERYL